MRYMKNDVAELLRSGMDANACDRAESLLAEMNIMSCYDFIEQFCTCISNHATGVNKQSECPEECKEAVSSLMFAAARFADFPELRDLRYMFTEKYDRTLDSFANKEFVGMLNQKHFTDDMKIQLMRDIAQELSVEWTPATKQDDRNKQMDDGQNRNVRGKKFYVVHPYRSESEDKTQTPQSKYAPSSHVKENKATIIRDPEQTKTESQNGWEEDGPPLEGDAGGRSQPKPHSVRTRSLKPPPGGLVRTRTNSFEEDEDERIMDELLDRYSSRKSLFDVEKAKALVKLPPSRQAAGEPHTRGLNHVRRMSDSSVPSARTSSLPAETPNPPTPRRGHLRTASMQPNRHVHPKLPDFDDLPARLAAFREMYK